MLHDFTDMDEELYSWKGHFGISDAACESLRNVLLKYCMLSGHVQRVSHEETLTVKERPRRGEPLYDGSSFADAQTGRFSPNPFVPLTHVRKLCRDRQCRRAAHVG